MAKYNLDGGTDYLEDNLLVEADEHGIRPNLTASVQFTLLIVVLVLSLLENLFLFLISFSAIHRRCRDRYVKRRCRHTINSSNYLSKCTLRKGGTINGRVAPRLRNGSEEFWSNEQFGHTSVCEPSSDSEVIHGSHAVTFSSDRIGNITRHYFANLCLANLLLVLLAMPFSIAASIGTSTKPSGLRLERNDTWHSGKAEHHDNIILKYPLIISSRMCIFIESVVCGLMITTVYSLVQLTADRLLAICLPLHYPQLVTPRRALISILFVWLASGLFVSITHVVVFLPDLRANLRSTMSAEAETDIYRCFILGQHDEKKHWRLAITFFVLVFLIPFVFIAVAYLKIYQTVRRCLKQLAKGNMMQSQNNSVPCLVRSHSSGHSLTSKSYADPMQPHSGNSSSTPFEIGTSIKRTYTFHNLPTRNSRKPYDSCSLSKQRRGQKVETKAAKTACILVTTFFSLTAPYFIFTVIEPFLHTHSSVTQEESQDELVETMSSIIVWLLYVNSVLTPGLYALRDGVLRRRISSIWFWPVKKRTSMIVRSGVE